MAAAIEQNHDEDGIIFPPAIAPFSVIITPVGAKDPEIDQTAEKIYEQLWEQGIDTLIDDRDERPGAKFKDADLTGIPVRITVGKKALADGKVELRNRRVKEIQLIKVSGIVRAVKKMLDEWQ